MFGGAGSPPLPQTAYWGLLTHILAMTLEIIGVATNTWVSSQTGSAIVSAGLWAVCTEGLPFLQNACDPIEVPSAAIFSARTFAVLGAIFAGITLILSFTVYAVLPMSSFFFVSFVAIAAPFVSCLLAIFSYGIVAAPKVATGAAFYGLAFAAFLLSWLLFGVTGLLYGLAFLQKRSEVQASSTAKREVADWATTGGKNKRRKKRRISVAA